MILTQAFVFLAFFMSRSACQAAQSLDLYQQGQFIEHSRIYSGKQAKSRAQVLHQPYIQGLRNHEDELVNSATVSFYFYEDQDKNLFRSRVIKLCITWLNRPSPSGI